MKLTLGVKALAAIIIVGLTYTVLAHYNLVPAALTQKAAVPTQFSLPDAAPVAASPTTAVAALSLPSTTPAPRKGAPVLIESIPWNAVMGLALANGGPVTTSGSLMEKYGVNVEIRRQNDSNKSQEGQIKFASALAKGSATAADGPAFVIIMGDGSAQYLAAANKALTRLGADYRAEVVGAVGYSRGEDGFWGPQAWKDDHEAMKGGLVAGVIRDGDWNIAQYLIAQDGIKNNPDEKTWDPEALNWVSVDDFTLAGEMYISNHCEDRDVVRNGRKTGERVNKCVQGYVTWTPGDVTAAKKKGGAVRLLSTKENAYQMPATLIGIHKWDVDHAKQVQDILHAAFDGAEQVRTYPEALARAGKASFAIWKEESPTYWTKYYKGVIESDRTQQPVPLGGSIASNLGDNLVLFGLAEGTGGVENSIFKATYEGFGNISKQQYPSLVPSFPPVTTAVNTTFLEALSRTMTASKPETSTFEPGAIDKENVVARREWSIQFDTGKATFTGAAPQTLQELYTALSVGTLSIDLEGHTDNVGDPGRNRELSKARALAVQTWLNDKAPKLFPTERFNVQAFGDTKPLTSNDSPAGRARNRRVTIVLGTK